MIGCGIDVGSRSTKLVLYDGYAKKIIAAVMMDSQLDKEELVAGLFRKGLKEAGCGKKDIKKIISTGYGRDGISFSDKRVTEITCHARGVRYFFPKAKTVIEIGGQDSKVTRMDSSGNVTDFAMNDRCAAGTGRFLEVVAKLLGVSMSEMGNSAAGVRHPAKISSTCVVFAESEIIGLLANRIPRKEIIAGVQDSIVSRVMGLAGRTLEKPVIFTGGVTLVSGMRERLEKEIGLRIKVPSLPFFTGALGAAILALEEI